jgi:outer membrane protein assembly factor BamB
MGRRLLPLAAVALGTLVLAGAADWPQWRGPHRDNKVADFAAPETWPAELTQKWKETVGLGDASPALVGDRIYVFTRQGADEVIRCLNADTGKEVWKDKYEAKAVTGAAATVGGGHPGPRSSPAVADGKVCTFGVGGVLSCLDAATGKVAWRKDSKAWPMFYTSASPIIVEGKCIAYLGKAGKGDLVAYDLASGEPKWAWNGEAPSYGSPVLMTVDGTTQLAVPTDKGVVGIEVGNGHRLWEFPFKARWNSGTPIIDGQTVIYSGPPAGTVAFKVEKGGDGFTAKPPLWKKRQAASQFNTPVLKHGLLFGLAAGRGGASFFCMDARTGDVLWTDSARRGECGAVLDAGSVLLALTSDSNLVAFKPDKEKFTELAHYKVADTPSWAYPIVSGKRIFVKDKDTLALWVMP